MSRPGPKPGTKKTPEHLANIKAALPRGTRHHNFKGDAAKEKTGRTRAQMLYTAIGPCERCGAGNAERHHRDGNTLNNAPTNIAILCRRCHMEEDGRLARIKEVRACVRAIPGPRYLSDEQIREMVALRAAGLSQARIATHFGIGQSAVSRILSGRRRQYAAALGEGK
jgi:hypothetical protein